MSLAYCIPFRRTEGCGDLETGDNCRRSQPERARTPPDHRTRKDGTHLPANGYVTIGIRRSQLPRAPVVEAGRTAAERRARADSRWDMVFIMDRKAGRCAGPDRPHRRRNTRRGATGVKSRVPETMACERFQASAADIRLFSSTKVHVGNRFLAMGPEWIDGHGVSRDCHPTSRQPLSRFHAASRFTFA